MHQRKYFLLISFLLFILLLGFALRMIWAKLEFRTKILFEITKGDPLFYSPGIDTAELKKQTEKLLLEEALSKEELGRMLKKKQRDASETAAALEQITNDGFLPDS